jgi:hypothetical protein
VPEPVRGQRHVLNESKASTLPSVFSAVAYTEGKSNTLLFDVGLWFEVKLELWPKPFSLQFAYSGFVELIYERELFADLGVVR